MVSVIIPYNRDRGYLDAAIQSVHDQTYTNWELILEHSDKFFGANLNRGVAKSKGEYIKFLAEDDLLTPDSLAILTEGIKGYDFVYSNAENFGEIDGWERFSNDSTTTLKKMLEGNCIHGGTLLYRRDMFIEVGGYDEDLWTAEEYDFHLKLLKHGYKHRHIPGIVYRYRIHVDNKSQHDRIVRSQYIEQIKKRYV